MIVLLILSMYLITFFTNLIEYLFKWRLLWHFVMIKTYLLWYNYYSVQRLSILHTNACVMRRSALWFLPFLICLLITHIMSWAGYMKFILSLCFRFVYIFAGPSTQQREKMLIEKKKFSGSCCRYCEPRHARSPHTHTRSPCTLWHHVCRHSVTK